MTEKVTFPSLISEDIFKVLDGFLTKEVNLNASYPYNVINVHNEETGDVVSTRLEFAFAGFSKEDITVKVIDQELFITASNKDELPVAWTFNHRGISKREFKTSIKLSPVANVPEIKSQYKDGLLVIDVPVKAKEITDIDIVVD